MKKVIPVMTELGFSAIQTGDLAKAESIFISIIDSAENDAAGSIGLAIIKLSAGDIDAAIDRLENGLEKATTNAHEARKLLLIAYMLKGNDSGAGDLHRKFVADSGPAASDHEVKRAELFFGEDLC